MNKIQYKSITIEGFQGIIDEFTFPLNLKGINIISGENGVGKTTVVSAFIWAQFGITAKKTNSPDPWAKMMKLPNYKGTRVSLNFSIGDSNYILTRCKDYKGEVNNIKVGRGLYISLLKDGEELLLSKDKSKAQEYIENLIGYTSHLYLNSIIFCQKAIRVLGMGGSDRKNLFEDIFEVSFIEEALNKAKTQLDAKNLEERDLELEYTTLYNKSNSLEETLIKLKDNKVRIKFLKEQYQDLKERNKELVDHLPDEVDMDKIQQKENELLSKFDDTKSSISKLESKRDYLNYKLHNIQKSENGYKKELEDLKNSGNCPTCGQPLKSSTAIKEKIKGIKKSLDQLSEDRIKNRNEFNEIVSKITELEAKVKKIKDKLSKTKEENRDRVNSNYKRGLILKDISHNKEKIKLIKEELASFKGHKEIKEIYHKTKEELKGVNKRVEDLSHKIEENKEWVQAYSWVIEDPLSNKGIKPYILQSLITSLNKISSQYSSLVGFQVIIDFDLNSVSKAIDTMIAFPDGSIAKYEDLSGGQQQLADLIILLSINKLRNNTRPLSIIILDELFEHLCTENVNKVFSIIQNSIDKEDSIYIITHNEEFKPQGTNQLYFSSPSPGKLSLERL